MQLATTYLGLTLRNPIVASSSPLWDSISNIRAAEDSGISAVVLPSIFEEQFHEEGEHLQRDLTRGTESFGEALSYLPVLSNYNLGPAGYLELIRKAKLAVSIPVIASLNGTSRGGWLQYARDLQQAGCDAIELNLYSLVSDPLLTSVQVENDYCELVRALKSSLRIPLAVKLSHFLTAPANLAGQLDLAGADALVLFNRFYQPDFDIEQLEIIPRLALSDSQELLLRLHWVAIMYGRVQSDLAITGGVHTAEDVIKSIMAGAKVAMMTSALLQKGVRHATSVLADLSRWMEEHEYESIHQMRGSMSYRSAANPAAFERVNYMRTLSSYAVARDEPAA
jgi:dihydroorotate dehydrogenase (fumarate)